MPVTHAGSVERLTGWGVGLCCTAEGKPVTLVCTDVEGSTELWEWDKDAMNEAQALHDRILRSQITEFYGYEVRRRCCAVRVMTQIIW